MTLLKVFKGIVDKLKRMHEMRKYDDFTIAEYFRKQGATIGDNCRILIRALGPEPYLIKIGNHVSISSGTKLLTHDGGGWIFTDEDPTLQRFEKIEIKDNCYIGVDCIILPGVVIGPNSIVGAGSVVTKDVPPNTVVAGNPARVIKTTEEYKEKIARIWKAQKPERYMVDFNLDCNNPASIYREKIKFSNRNLLKHHLSRIFWEE